MGALLVASFTDNQDLKTEVYRKLRYIESLTTMLDGVDQLYFDEMLKTYREGERYPLHTSGQIRGYWTPSHVTHDHMIFDWEAQEDQVTNWTVGVDASCSFIVVDGEMEVFWKNGSIIVHCGDMVNIRAGNKFMCKYTKGTITACLYYRDTPGEQDPMVIHTYQNIERDTWIDRVRRNEPEAA